MASIPLPSGALERFLRRMAHRLRLVWAVATASWVAPATAVIALVLVAVGRLVPWRWPEPAALVVVGTVLAGIAGWALVQRLPAPAVARAADRGLSTGDSFGAALQFQDLDGPFGERIRQRAETLAAGASADEAAPIEPNGRRWALAAVVGATALLLGFAPNPQDDVRAEQARTEALILAEADRIDEEADALAGDSATEALAAELQALADELRDTDDLDEARRALQAAQDALDARQPNDLASRRAAVEGLERGLAERPLAAGGGAAAEQLEALGEELDGLSAEEQAALAERLEDLAATQEAGNPETAAALAEAAAALQAGDTAGAAAALAGAAVAQAAAGEALRGQLAAGQAAGQLGQAAAVLSRAATGQSAGAGQGQGAGEGEGAGEGAGEGEGAGGGGSRGAGQGQGQGSGTGGDGAQGNVGGAQGGTGEGQGGVGRPGGTNQPRLDTNDNETATIIDPNSIGPGEETPIGGTPTGDSAEVIGQGDGPTTAGPARVPLRDVVDDYADRATSTADRQQLPPGQRQLVGDYFELLTGDER
jgi:hypothetical protein